MTKEEHLAQVEKEEAEKLIENNIPKKGTTDVIEKEIPKTVDVETGSLKDKLIARTDRMGVTEGGSIVKGVFWGLAIGVALTVAYFKREEIKTLLKVK